jgi:hypothetical protein
MPENNDTHDMDMEVFAAGNWHGDTYSKQDLADIVSNFNELRESVKPFLKLGHRGQEEQPALGWIESLKTNGEKIVAHVKDIPKIVFEAIKRKLYHRVSSEIYWNYKAPGKEKTYNYVLKAVALLGASVPEVKTLKDLTAYLSEQETAEKLAVYEFESDDQIKIVEIKPEKEGAKMPDIDVKQYEEQVATAKAAESAALAAKETAETALKEFKEAESAKVRERSVSEVKAFCEQAVKDGKLPPFVRDAMFPKEGQVLTFSDTGVAMLPFEVLKTFVEKVKGFDFSEKGASVKGKDLSEKNPGEIVDIRARELLDAKKCKTYSEAFKRVLSDDPELAKDYASDPGKAVTV